MVVRGVVAMVVMGVVAMVVRGVVAGNLHVSSL